MVNVVYNILVIGFEGDKYARLVLGGEDGCCEALK